MPKGIYIPADQEAPLERRDLAGLEDYQAAVGGYIEAVDLPEAGATLFVNEEGLLRKLLFNPRATFLWWFWVPAARHKAMLVGDAILVGSSDSAATRPTSRSRSRPACSAPTVTASRC